MKFVTPKVYHLAGTQLNERVPGFDASVDPIGHYVGELGNPDWYSKDPASGAEELIEVAGRRCYKSFGTELNPNISKVREGNALYIDNVLKSGHGSVIEHAYDTFAIENVSRVFTHELVRHRHCNFSQESMRFVRPTDLGTLFPEAYEQILGKEKADEIRQIYQEEFERAEAVQARLVDICGLETMPSFADKKKLQSSNRRLIPDGMATGIIITANHRNWRHLIALRTSIQAEEEIRYVFYQIFKILKEKYPALYQDSEESTLHDSIPEITFNHGRV